MLRNGKKEYEGKNTVYNIYIICAHNVYNLYIGIPCPVPSLSLTLYCRSFITTGSLMR